MVELQADCYAGLWAQRSGRRGDFAEQGDAGEALAAASAIGNDRLLGRPRGTVMPDPLTHGTTEQRERWFRTGLAAGGIDACETFAAPEL
jgi:predicted metalloprotease